MIGQLGRHPCSDLIDFGVVEGPAERNWQGKGDRSYLVQKAPIACMYFEVP